MGCNYHETQSLWHEEQHQQLDFTVQQFDTSFRRLFPVSYWARNVWDCLRGRWGRVGGVGCLLGADVYNQAYCTYTAEHALLRSSSENFVLKPWPVVWSVMPPRLCRCMSSFSRRNVVTSLAQPKAKRPLFIMSFTLILIESVWFWEAGRKTDGANFSLHSSF